MAELLLELFSEEIPARRATSSAWRRIISSARTLPTTGSPRSLARVA